MEAKLSLKIFAKNYRGFKNICIDLDKNIFLVGDNSSGKTSILHLISYVLNTELSSSHELDDTYSVDRYDFFSPYFNYDDVTIGFLWTSKGKVVAKVITLRYIGKGKPPKLIKYTSFRDDVIVSVKILNKSILAKKIDYSNDLNVDDILGVHAQNSGFKSIAIMDDDAFIDDTGDLVPIILKSQPDIEIGRPIILSLGKSVLPGYHHCGPVRALPEKFYNFERKFKASGAHFAAMWHDIKNSPLGEDLNLIKKFGEESRLFTDIDVEVLSKKIEEPPLMVTVNRGGKNFFMNQVGVGVSQVVPIIIESIFTLNYASKDNSVRDYMLLQQPELHLHPVAQAAMGELIYNISKRGLFYIIETHSDYIIDRYRAKIRESGDGSVGAKILYCENGFEGNNCSVININDDGTIDNVPDSYKKFFVSEILRTMF